MCADGNGQSQARTRQYRSRIWPTSRWKDPATHGAIPEQSLRKVRTPIYWTWVVVGHKVSRIPSTAILNPLFCTDLLSLLSGLSKGLVWFIWINQTFARSLAVNSPKSSMLSVTNGCGTDHFSCDLFCNYISGYTTIMGYMTIIWVDLFEVSFV